jgi:adhesin/invasin
MVFASSAITARVLDITGNPCASGLTVDFTATLGTLMPTTAVTGDSGTATVYMSAPSVTGISLISASCGSVTANTSVTIIGSEAARIVLMPRRSYISLEQTDTLDVYVYDDRDEYISDGTRVIFSSRLGLVVPPVASTSSGRALSVLIPRRTLGVDTIIASVGSVSDTAFVNITSGPPSTIVLSAEPETLYANGVSTSVISARLLDVTGNPVGSGFTVNFTTDQGTITPLAISDTSGVARSIFTSSTTLGTALVTATIPGASAIIPLTLIGSNAATVMIIPYNTSIGLDDIDTLEIFVYDSLGRDISDGTMVSVTAILSQVTPRYASTSSGRAMAFLDPRTTTGTDTVIATVGSASDTVLISIRPGNPSSIIVRANPDSIYANGIASSSISASVLDRYGNAIGSNKIVNFSTDRGSITPTALTDSTGIAVSSLVSSVSTGIAIVRAEMDEASGMTNVVFMPSSAASMVLSSNSYIISLGDSASLQATVYDSTGLEIANGTRVFFSSVKGSVMP